MKHDLEERVRLLESQVEQMDFIVAMHKKNAQDWEKAWCKEWTKGVQYRIKLNSL